MEGTLPGLSQTLKLTTPRQLKDPIPIDQEEKHLERIQLLIPNLFDSAIKLLDGRALERYFSTEPVEECVHVIVRIPTGEYRQLIVV
jgi:hypothetical protein